MAIGDFNGDGNPDLAVANQSTDNVSVLLGTGAGSFGAARNFTVGASPRSVAIGDLNGDGKLDLATANNFSDNVSVLLGIGTGFFGAKTDFAVGSSPFSVAIGDLNGDGKSDLATANRFSDNVSVLLGTGAGFFGAHTEYTVGSGPFSVAIGDLNGDSKPDLAATIISSNNVSVLLGTGSGSFGAKTDFAVGSSPIFVAIGDLNGDGKPDLAVANQSGGNVSVLLNTTPTLRRPVLIIPGIGATYSADTVHDLTWLVNRGVPPSQMQIDPMTRVYHDLIQTLENVGYVEGKDLFIVNYDWRLPPGPDDGSIDGQIGGLTAASISDQSYLYAVDYLGDILRQAAEQWKIDHPGQPPLDAVDVITHSTGGLVARTYIQSGVAAYGGAYASGKNLPKINNLIMIGVPNRGASKAWNPLHDNWVVDPAFQIVLSKIINRAYQKVLNGTVIGGPDYNINLASISPPNCQDGKEICFINQYVPTARALLATYDFIDFGSGLTNVNSNPGVRNSLLLDLNAGVPNAFADLVTAKPTIIYGTNGGKTPTTVVQKAGPTSTFIGFRPIAEFANFFGRDAGSGEIYYSDNKVPDGGDGTVPLVSSRNQFIGDSRVTLMPFTKDGNTSGDVAHTALPYNINVQKAILQTLGASFKDPTDISVNKHGYGLGAIQCASTCSNFGLDPVEGFMVDAQGRRLGFSAATGPMTEIPGSIWFGNAEGMGWVFGPVEEPLTIKLTGLGKPYYVTASVLTQTGRSGLIDQGVLGLGAQRVLPISPTAAPAWPNGSSLTASLHRVTSLTLTWTAANDTTGVTTYRVFKDGVLLATVAGDVLSYDVTNLTGDTVYVFKVEAGDAANNFSTNGPSVTARTLKIVPAPAISVPDLVILASLMAILLFWTLRRPRPSRL